jgi:Spy/CpxP family protein refolding chaperone
MNNLGLAAAVMALALGAYVAITVNDQGDRIAELERELAQRAPIAAVTDLDAIRPAPDLLTAEGGMQPVPEDDAADAVVAEVGAALATRDAPRPQSTEERLAALEKTVSEQRETIAQLEEEKSKEQRILGSVRGAMNDRFYHDVDAAAKSLELNERQKQDMKDIADRAQRELADLMDIPNDEGVTWKDASKIKLSGGDAEGGVTVLMSNFSKMAKFKKSRIPGSSETYGEAEKRIRDRALGDMRNILTPAQTEKWDKAHKDALIRPPGGPMSIAFATSSVVGEDR